MANITRSRLYCMCIQMATQNSVFQRLTAQWSLYVPHSGHYIYHTVVTIYTTQWSLYVPPSLTFNNSTFCPHSVFMCFVWIWEQTAIISLYSINWLVCITETECVYCAVRTGCSNTNQVMSVLSSLHNKCRACHCIPPPRVSFARWTDSCVRTHSCSWCVTRRHIFSAADSPAVVPAQCSQTVGLFQM
jgi:hypothetical protein